METLKLSLQRNIKEINDNPINPATEPGFLCLTIATQSPILIIDKHQAKGNNFTRTQALKHQSISNIYKNKIPLLSITYNLFTTKYKLGY